jgi:hypothetical protein
MKRSYLLLAALLLLVGQPAYAQSARMNFFLTSAPKGDGANLGGLEGADDHCALLGYAAGFGDLIWRAYLSTTATETQPAVNARDRIGSGPWYNYRGVEIAADLDQLHGEDNNLNQQTALTDRGQRVNGREDSPNHHDILTGSQPDGTAFDGSEDTTCRNWTSNAAGSAVVGHHDRQGGGPNPTSWNSSHRTRGCSQEDLVGTGGNGLFFCFGTTG